MLKLPVRAYLLSPICFEAMLRILDGAEEERLVARSMVEDMERQADALDPQTS